MGSQAARGLIYFAAAQELGERIKIGFSTNPARRMRQLKSALGVEPRVLGVLSGCIMDEMRIHEEFAEYRLEGEWFSCATDVLLVLACTDPYDPTHTNNPPPAYGCVSVTAHELKEWRGAIGWTQSKSAKWFGVSTYKYRQWELGRADVWSAWSVWDGMSKALTLKE